MTTTANSSTSGALSRQPENDNLLSPLGFRFSIRRLPNVTWFLQTLSLPGLTVGTALHPTPWHQTTQPGDTVTFGDLSIGFKVDENLENWIELQSWMRGLGSPTGSEDYRLNQQQFGADAIVSDATLVILNSNMQPSFRVIFHDLYPTNLGDLDFDTSQSDVGYISTSAEFSFLDYQYEKI